MDDAIEMPNMFEMKYVTIWLHREDDGSWNIELDYPPHISPYEAYGMLVGAMKSQKEEMDAAEPVMEDEDEEEDEET